MKYLVVSMTYVFAILFLIVTSHATEELYMITLTDGSSIIVKSYTFTDEYVEFTTENDLPGYVKKREFAEISNMVGVPPGETKRIREQVSKEERSKKLLLLSAAVLAVLFAIVLVYLGGRKKKNLHHSADIFYGRKEKEPTTQGHLSFEYKSAMGKKTRWTVDVRSAQQEEGDLFGEGFCTTTGKRKTFRASRVIGLVKDMSSDYQAPMEHFFVDLKEEG